MSASPSNGSSLCLNPGLMLISNYFFRVLSLLQDMHVPKDMHVPPQARPGSALVTELVTTASVSRAPDSGLQAFMCLNSLDPIGIPFLSFF